MKEQTLKMGYDVKYSTYDGILKPTTLSWWSKSEQTIKLSSKPGFKYFNDVLVGMNFHALTGYKYASAEDQKFISKYLKEMDPYHQIFESSQNRLKHHIPEVKPSALTEAFENEFTTFINDCFTADNLQFHFLNQGLNLIAKFEKDLGKNLIYNFDTKFSDSFNQKLICFYSLLFHVRTLFAVEHNKHTEDLSTESVKCDSITDYLAKSDYTTNDALVYWQFKKLSIPFSGSQDVKVGKLLVDPLESAFRQYNYHACVLIDNLPESFLTNTNVLKLEDKLYKMQMDWLLGSSTGLLFRLREELFGVTEGYNAIFWPEMNSFQQTKSKSLSFFFELKESFLFDQKKSAA